ncbi:hypothetical protein LH464_21350 [Neorhizobium sp. T786]|uniref:portal protein n=1 Tax=Pseudorhizobium xiangyangii TaxID=2883104 RepID=UPI001CFF6935|nr:hypothetical protein [Neorhizobium xiangyangii]MCB5205016.1 hypothetical protein [Neorhizobium xiangyangii]
MLANHSGYAQGSGPAQAPAASTGDAHATRKKEYLAYLEQKNEEIKEQQEARRYYHGAQLTDEQIKKLRQRRQPPVIYNRIGRKINAVVGLLERQRQDPRGFPRTPKHEEGAEIATAVLRFVCDEQEWPTKSSVSGMNGAVDGLAGVEITLVQGRDGVDVGLQDVDPSSFFYDPRSLKWDFSDARYMGVGKWSDIDAAIEMFPDSEQALRESLQSGSDLTSNPDTDNKWISTGDKGTRVRIIDHWFIKGGNWHYCIYTGAVTLAEGISPFKDEKGRTICKYIMYSANIDHEGDRYGFVRNMRSSQDEINQRRSKGLHVLNSRRMIIQKGTGEDTEKLRREAARPDGVIEYVGDNPPSFDDGAKGQELQGQLAFLEDAKNEIENYGFNPALIGQGVDKMSGRAMQIQQQAGIAELGPYLLAFRGWKLRVYRALWNAVQEFWTGEKWIRVTDDEGLAQFFAVNQLAVDPMTGQPTLVNALGALDVDIIIDEGPDTINMQQDAYDTLSIMATKGQNVPPQLLIELSPLQGKVKKRAMDILNEAQQQAAQPNPLAMAGAEAEVADKRASAMLKEAQAQKALADAGAAGMGQPQQGPSEIEIATALADLRNKNAATDKTVAETDKIRTETSLKPVEVRNSQIEAERSRDERFAFKQADMTQRREMSRQNAGA